MQSATMPVPFMVLAAIKAIGTISRTLEEAQAAINIIDLSMVKQKLMDPEEGQGWSVDQADQAELRYRRYLCMLFICRDGSIVPTKDIDIFWHQHILDTHAYAA